MHDLLCSEQKQVPNRNRKRLIKRIVPVVLATGLLVLLLLISKYPCDNGRLAVIGSRFSPTDTYKLQFKNLRHGDCKGLYLDVGTNVGTQIRKLYQPQFFPGSKSIRLFQSVYAGLSVKDVCTYGFEPNPEHEPWLHQLQESLNCQDYNVKIFTQTAVHTKTGNMTFFRDVKTPKKYKEWGASLTNWQNNSQATAAITVQTIDLTSFLQELFGHIYPRKIPVLMKMDIEGAEYGILEKMLSAGVMCQVSKMIIEWHPRMSLPGINTTRIRDVVNLYETVNSCNFTIIHEDDESYQLNSTDIPLTACDVT